MPGTRQLLLFPRAHARVPCREGRKKKGASSTHSKVELGSPAKAGWKHMVWAPSLRGAPYFALSNPSCPHSPPGCPADSWKTPGCLQGSVNPAGGIPERAPTTPGPALLPTGTQRERKRAFQSRARARELPAYPCSSGSRRTSANGGRSRPSRAGLSLLSHGASAHSGRFQATPTSQPRKGAEGECLASGRG